MTDLGRQLLDGALQNRTTGELVFEYLKREIIVGHLTAGEQLVERELTKRFDVSRTPLRDALKELVRLGLAVNIPYRGVFVRTLSYDDAQELYQIRIGLEGMAAALAAEHGTPAEHARLAELQAEVDRATQANDRAAMLNANTQFHDQIARASHNQRLAAMLENLWDNISLIRGAIWAVEDRGEVSGQAHWRLVETITRREAAAARQVAEEHTRSSWEFVARKMREKAAGNEAEVAADPGGMKTELGSR